MKSKTSKSSQPLKTARNAFLGVRLSKSEIATWDALHLGGGQTRSEVVRNKLGIGEKARVPRPSLNGGQAYDYWRAMRIRIAFDQVMLMLGSILELDEADRSDALGNAMTIVLKEAQAIRYEVSALMTRSELFLEYPAGGLQEWPEEVS